MPTMFAQSTGIANRTTSPDPTGETWTENLVAVGAGSVLDVSLAHES